MYIIHNYGMHIVDSKIKHNLKKYIYLLYRSIQIYVFIEVYRYRVFIYS